MYDSPRDLIDSMAAAPDALEGILVAVDDDLARRARGGDEGWSVVEVVCHLRDAEERARRAPAGDARRGEPSLAAYDQDAWAIERGYAGRGPAPWRGRVRGATGPSTWPRCARSPQPPGSGWGTTRSRAGSRS